MANLREFNTEINRINRYLSTVVDKQHPTDLTWSSSFTPPAVVVILLIILWLDLYELNTFNFNSIYVFLLMFIVSFNLNSAAFLHGLVYVAPSCLSYHRVALTAYVLVHTYFDKIIKLYHTMHATYRYEYDALNCFLSLFAYFKG